MFQLIIWRVAKQQKSSLRWRLWPKFHLFQYKNHHYAGGYGQILLSTDMKNNHYSRGSGQLIHSSAGMFTCLSPLSLVDCHPHPHLACPTVKLPHLACPKVQFYSTLNLLLYIPTTGLSNIPNIYHSKSPLCICLLAKPMFCLLSIPRFLLCIIAISPLYIQVLVPALFQAYNLHLFILGLMPCPS